MNAPPGKRHFASLFGVLLGLTGLCGTASAEVAITNRFTPSTMVVGGSLQYSITVNSTEVTPLLNAGLTHTVSGVAALNAASATSSCGGTVTVSGASLTWSGGTVPAAPPSGSSSCTVSVTARANATPSTYTTTINANTFSNTLGASNRFASSASFNSTPLTLPIAEGKAVDARVGYEYFGMRYVQGLPNAKAGTVITNPNAAPLTVASGTLNVSPHLGGTPTIQGAGCSAAFGTPRTTSAYTSVDVANLILPANGTCTVVFDVTSTTRLNYQAYAFGLPNDSAFSINDTKPNLLLTSVTEDTSMNGKTVQQNVASYGRAPIGFAKLINHGTAMTVSGGQDNRLTLSLLVKNNTREVRRFTYRDPLIGAGDYTNSSLISVPETRDQENTSDHLQANPVPRSAPICSTTGATLDVAAKAVQYTDVAIPPVTTCRFDVTFTLPRGSSSGVLHYGLMNSEVATDFLPSNQNTGAATSARLTVQTEGTLTFGGSTGHYLNEVWLSAVINNPSGIEMTGVDFGVPWASDLPFTFDAGRSYSTCGGALTPLPGGKGATFRGGRVPSLGTCKVVLAITPSSVTGEANANVSVEAPPSFTSSSGHQVNSVSGGTSIALYGNQLSLAAATSKVPTGAATGRIVTFINQSAQVVSGRRVTLSIAPQEAFVPRDISVSCRADLGGPQSTYTIPFAAATVTGQSLTFTLRDVPPYLMNPALRVDEQPMFGSYPTRCDANIGVISSSAGTFNASVTMEDLANYHGPTPPALLTRSATATYVESPAYTINTTFAPQTVYAGQNTAVRLKAPTPTSSAYNSVLTRFRIVNTLPPGMEIDPQALTGPVWSKGTDGSHVYLNGYPSTSLTLNSACDATRTCTGSGVLVQPDLKTLVYYAGENTFLPDVPVLVTNFGDLTNTVPVASTAPVDGSTARIVADTSASVKVLPSLVARAFYGPSRIASGQTTTLSMLVVNANPVTETVRVRIPLTTDVTPTGAAVSGCAGTLSQTFTTSPRELVVTGVLLTPNEQCTLQVPVTARTGRSASAISTTIPAGYVTGPASNTGNQAPTTALLSVDPAPLCVARSATQVTPQQLRLTSPGKGVASIQYVNNGGDQLGTSDIAWTGTLPGGYGVTYAFDGAPAQTTLATAWASRVSQQGPLGVGQTTTLNVSYNSAAGKARGEMQSGTVTGIVSNGACSVSDTQHLTTIRAQGTISKFQAVCRRNPDGTVTCDPTTTSHLDVQPCTVLRYDLAAANTGDAPLLQARIREHLPSNVTFLSARAVTTGSAPLLYSVNGAVWSATPPTGGTVLFVGVDSNGDGAATAADALDAGATMTATVYVRVKGLGCAPIALPLVESSAAPPTSVPTSGR